MLNRLIAGFAICTLLSASPAGAQDISVAAGYANYDLAGVGNTWVAAVGVHQTLSPPFTLDLTVSRIVYGEGTSRRSFLIPEAGLSLGIPVGPVDLILSGGGGTTLVVSGPATREPTLYGGVSIDVPVGPVRIRPGSRIRWVDPWAGTILELTTAVVLPLVR